jgi:hypothetical protein
VSCYATLKTARADWPAPQPVRDIALAETARSLRAEAERRGMTLGAVIDELARRLPGAK